LSHHAQKATTYFYTGQKEAKICLDFIEISDFETHEKSEKRTKLKVNSN